MSTPADASFLDFLAFLTAWLGYLTVTVAMLTRYAGRTDLVRWAVPTMLVVVTSHVFLVWSVRFGFDPARAIEGGLPPAILLHGLFAMIVIHGLGQARSRFAGRLVYPSWGLVTMLGMPGAFFEPSLAWMRVPMVVTFLAGVAGLVFFRRYSPTRQLGSASER